MISLVPHYRQSCRGAGVPPAYGNWWFNPWLWGALAVGLLYLFARQFWRPGFRPALLAALAVALWWLAALFLLWDYVTASC